MVAPVKISRALSLMLLRDLPAYTARAEAAGIPPPKLSLEYADGLTRADAVARQHWGQKIPAVRAALGNLAHPDNGAVRAHAALTQHFAAVHPQGDNGEPAPWSEPLSIGMRAVLNGTDIPGKLLPPGEAQALLAYHATRADLVAANRDKADPLHDRVTAEIAALSDRAVLPAEIAPPPAPDSGATPQSEGQMTDTPDTRQQIDALLSDPDFCKRYFSKHERGHDAAVAEMARLHEALIPGNAASSSTATAPVSRPAAAGLTEKLKDGNLRGQARQDVLARLETALAEGHAPAAAEVS